MTVSELKSQIAEYKDMLQFAQDDPQLLAETQQEIAKLEAELAALSAPKAPAAPETPSADKKPDGRANNGGNRKPIPPTAPVVTPPPAPKPPASKETKTVDVEIMTMDGKVATVEAESIRNPKKGEDVAPAAAVPTPHTETEQERENRAEAARQEKKRLADEKEEAEKAEKKRKKKERDDARKDKEKAAEEAAKLLTKEEMPLVVKFLVKHASDFVDAKTPNAQELKRVLVSKGEIYLEVVNHTKGIIAAIPLLRTMATEYLHLEVKGGTVTATKVDKPKMARQVIPIPEYIAILYNTRGWDGASEPHRAIHKFYKEVLKACLDGEITDKERDELETEYVKVTKAVAELDFFEFGVAQLYNEIREYKKTHKETSFWKAREAVIKSHLG